MTNYDIAMIHLRVTSGWVTHEQAQVLVLGASNTFEIKNQGKKRRRLSGEFPTDASKEELSQERSSYVLDGWRPLGNSIEIFIKSTEASPDAIVSFPERIKYLDELLRTEQIDDVDAGTLQWALLELEKIEEATTKVVSVEVVELLERLTELKRSGHLSNEEFLQAKKNALGM